MNETKLKFDKSEVLDSPLGAALSNFGLNSIKAIVALGPNEISEQAHISTEQAQSIYAWANSKYIKNSSKSGVISAAHLLRMRENWHKLSSGSQAFDRMISGGLEQACITEIYGSSATGKTQFCLTLAVNVQKEYSKGGLEGGVIYIDTENKFSVERVCQIASRQGLDLNRIMENIQLLRPLTSFEQERSIKFIPALLQKFKHVKVLIVDSIIANYRAEYSGRVSLPERQYKLYNSLHLLGNIAQVYGLVVVVTNQIHVAPDNYGNKNQSVGGNVMAHASRFRIQFSGTVFCRTAKIVSSPCHPVTASKFIIDDSGIGDESSK